MSNDNSPLDSPPSEPVTDAEAATLAEPVTLQMKVDRDLIDQAGGPRMVSKFFFMLAGEDFFFEVGYTDLNEIKVAIETVRSGRPPAPTRFRMTHSFIVPVFAQAELLIGLRQAVAALEKLTERRSR